MPLLLLCAAASAYQEAPMLAERVSKGELPPVEQRLPEHPAVVQPVHSIGKYGGAWRRLAVGNHNDLQLSSRLGYEPPVRWDSTGHKVIPAIVERWDVLDDGRTYVLYLRKGIRWSDGHPFTTEDFMFYYEDILQNKELSPVFPSWLVIDGVPAKMIARDEYILEVRFAQPYGIFLDFIAFVGNSMLFPKHYLKQYHPKYTDIAQIEKTAKEHGLDLWYQLFGQQSHVEENPDLPTLKPFILRTAPPAMRIVCERNPYYWKVDPEGNQLPYLDQIVFTMVQNAEIANFKAMTGDVDFQDRHMDTANFPLFMENRKKGKYHVMRHVNPTATVIYLNQYSKDPDLRVLLQDRRFRIALSVAINRKELIDLMYSGMGEPARGVASPFDNCYLPEFDAKYLEYDPGEANRLLDELGLVRDDAGMRAMPGGAPFRQILNVYPAETGISIDMWQLIADYWREVGLDFIVKMDAPSLSVLQVSNGNSDFWAYLISGVNWIVDPVWYVPWQSNSYFAPLFGRYHATNGKGGVNPTEPYQRLVDWYCELRSIVNDDDRRLEVGRRILRQWADEAYIVGVCRSEVITIVSDRFKNVPDEIIHDYRVMTPGYIGIEQFYIDEGE